MKFKVYSADASSSTEKDFDNFPAFEGNKGLQALKDVIVAYQANNRQGTAKAKTRSDVNRTGKKVYRQKGTGNARHGDRGAPIFVGGGVAHGPKVRDWSKHINKRVKTLAFKRALFNKASEGGLDLIEKFEVEQPKTKLFNSLIGKIQPKGKVLIVDSEFNDNAALAARNIDRVYIVDADSINAWDLMRFDKIVASEEGFNRILERANQR
ncbi:50S ribosomal protein L4 [Ruficoccus amylovorans]|uniref:Large ribosomal subunit protein uL4 n=1 Tax=Ruficoccus amylovorans TaxID=1804625 RepID=A0A842HA01_9BACT|nr:50S ribosomal protein L4 [Ruficoccus amylovorans]MBC2593323.1 50S ribosomal protein L4 [Ruficoccus amylovorans]